jgi:hypothetical protein
MKKLIKYKIWLSYQCSLAPTRRYEVKATNEYKAYQLAVRTYDNEIGETKIREIWNFHGIAMSPLTYIERIK